MPEDRKACFVIMPFSETTPEHTEVYWTTHFTNFLKLLIEENPSLEARRSQALRGDILKEIITEIIVAPIVVADLTDRNANVLWELGVRQSFKHGTVTIAQSGETLPFDLSSKGTLFYYPKDYIKSGEFRTQFKVALQDCLAHPERPDSQVLEAIYGRGTLFELFRRDEAIRRIDALVSELAWHLVTAKSLRDSAKQAAEAHGHTNRFFRFYAPATELLRINRYLEEGPEFYQLVERYYDSIQAMGPLQEKLRYP